MIPQAKVVDRSVRDRVSAVLKWVLLGVAIATFGLLAWATTATYRRVPPQPERIVGADGVLLMTGDKQHPGMEVRYDTTLFARSR